MRLRTILQFGDFQFDPETPLLTRQGRLLELSPKALQVLAVLVKNAGRVVSKDKLLNIVWPNSVVEEGNLAVHVLALRKALGKGAETGDYIENIPKRGYRFAARVVCIGEGASASLNGAHRNACSVAGHYIQQQTAEGCIRAARKYRECLAIESRNVQAKTGLANTLLFRLVLGDLSSDEAVAPAGALLDEASQIDPACADVRLSRARLLSLGYWRWDRAQEELQRAVESPVYGETEYIARAWQGFSLVERGDLGKGLRRLRWADAGSPVNPFVSRLLADAYFLARDFSTCVAVSRKALQLHPHSWLQHRVLAKALTALGESAKPDGIIVARRCSMTRHNPACKRSSRISKPRPVTRIMRRNVSPVCSRLQGAGACHSCPLHRFMRLSAIRIALWSASNKHARTASGRSPL
jgi:DNA-binding winged helix-turn-helix (wHTH) protein